LKLLVDKKYDEVYRRSQKPKKNERLKRRMKAIERCTTRHLEWFKESLLHETEPPSVRQKSRDRN